jgi:hypothetical protein
MTTRADVAAFIADEANAYARKAAFVVSRRSNASHFTIRVHCVCIARPAVAAQEAR